MSGNLCWEAHHAEETLYRLEELPQTLFGYIRVNAENMAAIEPREPHQTTPVEACS